MSINAIGEQEVLPFSLPEAEGVIIPVGGGKDSVVSLELLKGFEAVSAMIVNPRKASLDTARAAGFNRDNIMEVKRRIDPALLELNAKGYLNGHTPFSSLLAFQTLLLAAISERKYIALSNESSANEPTVIGTNVNHQYSKSIEFEKDFRDYVKTYLCKDIEYFSFLRPLNELQIASLFSSFGHHHEHFRSCNVGSKEDKWCCNCPKCLFTYSILSPFLSSFELQQIFGEDLLDKESLLKSLDELCGIAAVKPFECVGTVDEVKTALCFAQYNYPPGQIPLLLRRFQEYFPETLCDDIELNVLLDSLEEEHFLPEGFLNILIDRLKQHAG